MSQTYFFELLLGDFTDLHETLHTASVDPPDKKVIEIILIFQTILKLLNNNFWQILFQKGSVAYLHIGVSKWHETQITTSSWAPKALCKIVPEVFYISTSVGRNNMKLARIVANALVRIADERCYQGTLQWPLEY